MSLKQSYFINVLVGIVNGLMMGNSNAFLTSTLVVLSVGIVLLILNYFIDNKNIKQKELTLLLVSLLFPMTIVYVLRSIN